MKAKTRNHARAEPTSARAIIRAMVLEGPTSTTEAAEAAGCSTSYARRIMRALEAEGIMARPSSSGSTMARFAVLELLLELGGDTATASEIAEAAGYGVKHVRKILCALEQTKAVASAEAGASWAVRVQGEGRADLWRIGEEAVELAEAELMGLASLAGEASEQAKTSRVGAAETFKEAEGLEEAPF